MMDFLNVQDILDSILSVLPRSPFTGVIDSLEGAYAQDILSYINWFVPVSDILSVLSLWCGAIGLYYIYSVVMRWIKVID